MQSLDAIVDSALKDDTVLIGLLGDELIYNFNEPGDRNISYPRVIYEEISNVPAQGADNIEQVARITYRVSACADAGLIEIINAVERVMISIGFMRHSAEPIRNLPIGVSGKVILFIIIKECV